jgi:hypothetical protein
VNSDLYVVVEDEGALSYVGEMTKEIETATVRAINKAADFARTQAQRRIMEQVAFPATYLNPSQGRLKVTARAKPGALEATVTGRGRPTSLARFAASSTPKPGARTKSGNRRGTGGGVSVTVKPGNKTKIARAFLVNLPGAVDSKNLGLAVRTDGGPPPGAYKPKQLSENVWLLYGPSVDQVLWGLRNNGGVIEELEPEILYTLRSEFSRQLNLKG